MVRLKLQADSQMVDQKVEVIFFYFFYLRCGVQNGIETTGKDESSPTGLVHSQDSKFDFIPSSKKTNKITLSKNKWVSFRFQMIILFFILCIFWKKYLKIMAKKEYFTVFYIKVTLTSPFDWLLQLQTVLRNVPKSLSWTWTKNNKS